MVTGYNKLSIRNILGVLLCVACSLVQSCEVSLTTDRAVVELGSRVAMTCTVCPGNNVVRINLNVTQVADYWKPANFSSVSNTSAYPVSTDILNNESHIYLMVLSLTTDQAGKYTCYIHGTQNQSSVTLLYAAPVNYVEMKPRDKTVSLLNNVTTNIFSCTSSNGRPTPVIRWYTDNETHGYYGDDSEITTASNSTISSVSGETTTSYLTFTPFTDDHGKMIYCNVSNGYGQIMSNNTPLIEILHLPSKPVISHNGNAVEGNFTVIENKTLSLNCVSEGNPNPTVTWIPLMPFFRSTSVLTIANIQTTSTGVYTCRANSTLSPTNSTPIENITTTWISTDVLYPPRPPECRIGNFRVVSNVLRAIRNESFRMICTSNSKPTPSNYTWTFPLGEKVNGQELSIGVVKSSGNDIFTIRIVNLMNPSFEQSVEGSVEERFTLNVLYPVSKPTIYHVGHSTKIDEITVLLGQSVHLQCNSSSNPPPTYVWSIQGEVSAQGAFKNQTIESDSVVVCNASNCMDPTGNIIVCSSRLAYLNIKTYFPPEKPVLNFTACGSSVVPTSPIQIIEGQSVEVSCTSISNPEPTYAWHSSNSRPGNIFALKNVSASQNGQYSCTATNDMNTTFNGVVKGTNTSVFHLEVLMPPRVHQIENMTVLLNTNLTIVCPFTVGNPPSTTFVWMHEKVTQTLGPTLSITGIQQIDEGRYTCQASNMMMPTNCEPQKGYTEKSFHLDVQYAAKITGYFASGFENQTVITVNENEQVELKCVFDSDPVANISIENGTRMLESGQTNTVIASIPQARCEYDATVYRCQGGNIHSTETQERVLEVFIKCAPRPSPFHPPVTYISRTLNGSVVLTFTIKAYPPPDISAYSWYRLIDITWEIITDVNSAHKSVSADGLQTNLSISRLQKGDFGLYRVSVFNELGNATQEYELRTHEKPESPINLHVKEGSLGVDSFTVEWEPGFHGGEEQTFIILYQMKDLTVQWTEVNVSSNTLNYSFVALNSGTTYLIKMFARNIVGKSEETEVLTATTLVIVADFPSKVTAVAVGTTVGGIFCITLAVVGAWCMIKRKRSKQRQVAMQYEDLIGQRGHEETSNANASYEICKFDSRPEKIYEALGETTFHECASLSLDNTQRNSTECAAHESSSSSTANKEYENLKLT